MTYPAGLRQTLNTNPRSHRQIAAATYARYLISMPYHEEPEGGTHGEGSCSARRELNPQRCVGHTETPGGRSGHEAFSSLSSRLSIHQEAGTQANLPASTVKGH